MPMSFVSFLVDWFCKENQNYRRKEGIYHISWPIRCIVIFSLEILEKRKNNDECILILVICWKETGLLHTKISNHNIIYSSKTPENHHHCSQNHLRG
jgi:hypothetical protein